MQLSNHHNISEAQLLNKRVLDRQGYLLGTVIAVDGLPNYPFILKIHSVSEPSKASELAIGSEHLTAIDHKNQVIHTDLEANLLVPHEGKTIPLMQERLVVNRQRHKVGEVVVRKVVETEWVQVPLYKEKLIIKKDGESASLAEISLGETQSPRGVAIAPPTSTPPATSDEQNPSSEPFVVGQWHSIDTVMEVLEHLSMGNGTTAVPVILSLYLKQQENAQRIKLEFPSSQLATQFLTSLDANWWHRCETVRLETP